MTQHEEDAEYAKIAYLQDMETTMNYLDAYVEKAQEEGLAPVAAALVISLNFIHRVYHEIQPVDAEEFLKVREQVEEGD